MKRRRRCSLPLSKLKGRCSLKAAKKRSIMMRRMMGLRPK